MNITKYTNGGIKRLKMLHSYSIPHAVMVMDGGCL